MPPIETGDFLHPSHVSLPPKKCNMEPENDDFPRGTSFSEDFLFQCSMLNFGGWGTHRYDLQYT